MRSAARAHLLAPTRPSRGGDLHRLGQSRAIAVAMGRGSATIATDY